MPVEMLTKTPFEGKVKAHNPNYDVELVLMRMVSSAALGLTGHPSVAVYRSDLE